MFFQIFFVFNPQAKIGFKKEFLMWLLYLPIRMSPFDKRGRKKGRNDQILLHGRLKFMITT
jgi:hypothetical protein